MTSDNGQYRFSAEKNEWLIRHRNISFEQAIEAIEEGHLIAVIDHPNQSRYPGQRMYVVAMNDYICLVPFVRESEESVFLKTIIPSRQAVKKWRKP